MLTNWNYNKNFKNIFKKKTNPFHIRIIIYTCRKI